MEIVINSIRENPSLCDGPGYRTVLFLQGCDLHCAGCQNESTWDISEGQKIDTDDLAVLLREKCFNKKLTISGGEPLLQQTALEELLTKLTDFDICIYTGHELCDVPKTILPYLKYIKVGKFVKSLKTSTRPFVGSRNQKFLKKGEINEQAKQQ